MELTTTCCSACGTPYGCQFRRRAAASALLADARRQAVLATGAIERPLAFPDNDRPGIMLAAAAAGYALRYGVHPGNEIVVFTNNDWAYRSAADLKRAGCVVKAVIDVRPDAGPGAALAEAAGIQSGAEQQYVRALGRTLSAVEVATLSADGTAISGAVERIDCDCLAVSGGFTPTVHLFSHARGKLVYAPPIASFVPGAGPAAVTSQAVAAGPLI